MVTRESILHGMQIHANRSAATIREVTFFDDAVLRATHAKQSIRLIVHVPVMLKPRVALDQRVAIAMHESQSAKN